jgi:hypothetical protein
MLGFQPISSSPVSTIELIGTLSIVFSRKIPIENQGQINPNIKTFDWILSFRNSVWNIKC